MEKINRIYPLMSYKIKIFGGILLLVAVTMLIISLLFESIYLDLIAWLLCFALFCIGYSKEKDENIGNDNNEYNNIRYHSQRISIALTTVVALISSFTFILEKRSIEINCLHTLIFFLLIDIIVYYLIRIKIKSKKQANGS